MKNNEKKGDCGDVKDSPRAHCAAACSLLLPVPKRSWAVCGVNICLLLKPFSISVFASCTLIRCNQITGKTATAMEKTSGTQGNQVSGAVRVLLVLPAEPLRNICVLSSSAAGSELTSITTASFFCSHPPRISGEDGAETGDTKEK